MEKDKREETMLKNGLDFILYSIQQLKEYELCRKHETNGLPNLNATQEAEHGLKYSLLHLTAGIELVLKSRLYIEHWTYIFADMNKANLGKVKSGDFKSVEADATIERLSQLCSINLLDDDVVALKRLRQLRNKIEHFRVTESVNAIESTINAALSVIIRFIGDNHDAFSLAERTDADTVLGLTSEEESLLHQITHEARTLREHYEDALATAKVEVSSRAAEESEIVKCPSCMEKTMLSGKMPHTAGSYCYFCGHSLSGEAVAEEYAENVLNISRYEVGHHGGEWPIYVCVDCGADAFVHDEKEHNYHCFSCGVGYKEDDIAFCEECGAAICCVVDDDIALCESCIEYKLAGG